MTEYVALRKDVFEYLLGERAHPDTGSWFERPTGAGAFWWRKDLRKYTKPMPTFGFEPFPNPPRVPGYHSPEWWDMLWKKHEAWREGNYPAPAATGYEVTPVSGVRVAD